MNRIRQRIARGNKETRTYEFTSDPATLDKFEEFLSLIQFFGMAGHSDVIKLFVDGDGAFAMNIKKKDGELSESAWDMETEESPSFSFD